MVALLAQMNRPPASTRLARIPGRLDALLKAGEARGAAPGETCRGLLAQFGAARQRAWQRLHEALR